MDRESVLGFILLRVRTAGSPVFANTSTWGLGEGWSALEPEILKKVEDEVVSLYEASDPPQPPSFTALRPGESPAEKVALENAAVDARENHKERFVAAFWNVLESDEVEQLLPPRLHQRSSGLRDLLRRIPARRESG